MRDRCQICNYCNEKKLGMDCSDLVILIEVYSFQWTVFSDRIVCLGLGNIEFPILAPNVACSREGVEEDKLEEF